MLRELEKNAVRKGLVQLGANWEGVTREDIYRQRVLGTRTGAEDFITYDDKRRLGVASLILYFLFIWASMEFTWRRVHIYESYKVNSVLKGVLQRATFIRDDEEKRWGDIMVIDDLESWLLEAFPDVITPVIQGFSLPLGDIRFTLRRMQMVENSEDRFRLKAPWVWKNKAGIDPSDTSSNYDNKTSFGAPRLWDTNKDTRAALGLSWCTVDGYSCGPGELLDEYKASYKVADSDLHKKCKDWCENLNEDSKPCRCFDISKDNTCRFYHVPEENLQDATPVKNGDCPISSRMPSLEDRAGFHTFWPRMERWNWAADAGWHATPGFVSTLRFWSQEDLNELAGDDVPPTQAQALKDQIKDYFQGGLLSKGMAALTVDFVTYNFNYQVYTHVSLSFRESAAGYLTPTMHLNSLKVTHDMVVNKSFDIWSDLHSWDVVYGVMLVVYLLIEMFEFGTRGFLYFHSPWNWFTMFTLMLHVMTIVTRWIYVGNQDFTAKLADFKTQPYTSSIAAFRAQYASFEIFAMVCAITLPLMWSKLIQYFNDVFPRVGVLVNSIYRAGTPIVFLVVITIDLFFAFVVCSFLLFGKSVGDFSTFGGAFTSSVELMFGNADCFEQLRDYYPVSGGIFFLLHVLLFFYILQAVGKAVVMSSYADATLLHVAEQADLQRRRAAEPPSQDVISRTVEVMKMEVDAWVTRKFGGSKHVRTSKPTRRHGKMAEPLELTLFVVFVLFYLLMMYFVVQVGLAHDLKDSIRSTITDATFTRPHLGAGALRHGKTFEDVETVEDVNLFLGSALPKVMFNSSQGTFEGVENPLKLYQSALPEVFQQLVVNNFNILVGQNPIRISTRYFKMHAAGSGNAIGGFVQASTMLANSDPAPTEIGLESESFFPPLEEATSFDEIVDPRAREVVQRHCSYKQSYGAASLDDANGFSCMLSVDYNETKHILRDLTGNSFVSNQTATLAVDFVAYNGFAETFVYTAILFQFQPNGEITKRIINHPVRMDMYGGKYWYRILLEVFVILLTHYFFGLCLKDIFTTLMDHYRTDRDQDPTPHSFMQRPWVILRAIVIHMAHDFFNLLEFISCIMMAVTMGMWYAFVFSSLSKEYFFPERPDVGTTTCFSTWCGDDDVIWAFYNEGEKVKKFARICGMNTLLIFLRMLKYLQVFPYVRIMFSTLRRAARDILWFMLMLIVMLFGFVCAGHQMFGRTVGNFSSLEQSFRSCAQMAVLTFNMGELREAGAFRYFLFIFSHAVICRFIMMNMFFGIIDKHYKLEYQKIEAGREVLAQTSQAGAHEGSFLKKAMTFAQGLFGRRSASASSEAIADVPALEDLGERRLAAMGGTPTSRQSPDSPVSPTSPRGPGAGAMVALGQASPMANNRKGTGDSEDAGEMAETAVITANTVKKTKNWQYLPPEMKSWALERAQEVHSLVEEFHNRRFQGQHNKHELDRILEEAESMIKNRRTLKHREAEEAFSSLNDVELRSLKEIHQDQESLAWYIMKREAELKKLESMRTLKQERHDKLVQAARSIVEDEEEAPNAEDQGPTSSQS